MRTGEEDGRDGHDGRCESFGDEPVLLYGLGGILRDKSSHVACACDVEREYAGDLARIDLGKLFDRGIKVPAQDFLDLSGFDHGFDHRQRVSCDANVAVGTAGSIRGSRADLTPSRNTLSYLSNVRAVLRSPA